MKLFFEVQYSYKISIFGNENKFSIVSKNIHFEFLFGGNLRFAKKVDFLGFHSEYFSNLNPPHRLMSVLI